MHLIEQQEINKKCRFCKQIETLLDPNRLLKPMVDIVNYFTYIHRLLLLLRDIMSSHACF